VWTDFRHFVAIATVSFSYIDFIVEVGHGIRLWVGTLEPPNSFRNCARGVRCQGGLAQRRPLILNEEMRNPIALIVTSFANAGCATERAGCWLSTARQSSHRGHDMIGSVILVCSQCQSVNEHKVSILLSICSLSVCVSRCLLNWLGVGMVMSESNALSDVPIRLFGVPIFLVGCGFIRAPIYECTSCSGPKHEQVKAESIRADPAVFNRTSSTTPWDQG
jgi:hypothetical protein